MRVNALGNLIIQDLKNVIIEYTAVNFLIALVLIAIMQFIKYSSGNTKSSSRLQTRQFFLVMYLCFLLELTFITREAGSRTTINFKLFGTYAPNPWAISYMVENVLLFIPFGFLVPLVCTKMRRFYRIVLFSLCSSVVIEIVQHLTERGFLQVDDIWLNVCGGICGYGILMALLWIAKRTKCGKEQGVSDYKSEISKQR